MAMLVHQRCFNHEVREAAARCPECHRFFCRECIAEHDDRVICAACLKKLAHPPLFQRRGFAGAIRVGQCALGLVMAWLFFYLIGEALLSMPDDFHKETLWKANWIDQE